LPASIPEPRALDLLAVLALYLSLRRATPRRDRAA
jgi:hypothetical protein